MTLLPEFPTEPDTREYIALFVVLAIAGLLLLSTSIEGPFTIDEVNYIVTVVGLRDGVMTVPGTEGLTPSREIFAFDPDAHRRIANTTPVFSAAPPLYGPIALPFLFLGWRGLVLINMLAFVVTGLCVFLIARSLSNQRHTAWIALLLALLGGPFLEFAQGVWPHMLSVALVTTSLLFITRVWRDGQRWHAMLGGLLIGIAVGIREQNIILAGALGLTLIFFSKERLTSTLVYATGSALPLAIIATMQYFRQGLWHPFPKVVAYAGHVGQQVSGATDFNPLGTLWTRFVDFSAQAEFVDPLLSVIYRKDPGSGAFLVDGVVKKALLQSSPWIALVLVAFVAVWLVASWRRSDSLRILKPFSILIASLMVAFSVMGIGRTDGLAYNQRYLLEVVPIAAIAAALVGDRISGKLTPFLLGLLATAVLVSIILVVPSQEFLRVAIRFVPLALAVLTALSIFFTDGRMKGSMIRALLGACLGWSLLVHTIWDLQASRARRTRNAAVLRELESVVPARSAVFAFGGWRDAAGALVMTRDAVILDVGADAGESAGRLARELDAKGRAVFVLAHGMPGETLRAIEGSDSLAVVSREPLPVFRLVQRSR